MWQSRSIAFADDIGSVVTAQLSIAALAFDFTGSAINGLEAAG
ncbi:MAG: hypothetical protein ABI882_05365 [Acidobacteriota bacterium]